MRSALLLLALTCTPAFCQDNAAQTFDDNLRQRLNEILAPLVTQAPARSPIKAGITPPLLVRRFATGSLCSIPLLNAAATAKPVPMPRIKTPENVAHPLDRMSVVAPAPACPADAGKTATPRANAHPETPPAAAPPAAP